MGSSFPSIQASSGFISFHFGLFGFRFLSFLAGPPHKLAKTACFLMKFERILSAPRPAAFCIFLASWAFISFHFGLLGVHFLSFWPFGHCFFFHFGLLGLRFLSFWAFRPLFPFIFAFWAFISFHFGLLAVHSLSFWPFWLSFPFILAFWAYISFNFGLLGLRFLSFWSFGPSFPFIFGLFGLPREVPPTSCQKRPVS